MDNASVLQKLPAITKQIADNFHPEKIILFGSYAWGHPGRDSDIDLFVIKKTTLSTREIAQQIDSSLWGQSVPIDIIVYTPENVKRRLAMGDFFIGDIMEKGKILYSAS